MGHFSLIFVSRTAAQKFLVGLLARCPEVPSQLQRERPPGSDEKQLLITMWVLGNPERIRSVSDRFNITEQSNFRERKVFQIALVLLMEPTYTASKNYMQMCFFQNNVGNTELVGMKFGMHF